MDAAEEVTAKKFVLVDDEGNTRAELSAHGDEVGLLVYGKGRSHGVVQVVVNQETGDPSVMVSRQKEGEPLAGVLMNITDGRAAIRLQDANRAERTILTNE